MICIARKSPCMLWWLFLAISQGIFNSNLSLNWRSVCTFLSSLALYYRKCYRSMNATCGNSFPFFSSIYIFIIKYPISIYAWHHNKVQNSYPTNYLGNENKINLDRWLFFSQQSHRNDFFSLNWSYLWKYLFPSSRIKKTIYLHIPPSFALLFVFFKSSLKKKIWGKTPLYHTCIPCLSLISVTWK